MTAESRIRFTALDADGQPIPSKVFEHTGTATVTEHHYDASAPLEADQWVMACYQCPPLAPGVTCLVMVFGDQAMAVEWAKLYHSHPIQNYVVASVAALRGKLKNVPFAVGGRLPD